MLGLLGLLIALVALVETDTASLLAWTERCVPIERYRPLFAAFLATWLAARFAPGPRSRRVALLAGSLATAALFDPGFAALSVAWVLALHRVVFGPRGRRVGAAWVYVGASYLALAIACNRDLFPELLTDRPWLARWGYVFALSYTFRIAWFLHQVRMRDPGHLPVGDLVTYFVFSPFFLIVPYMMAIPRCDRFCAGLDRHDLAIERSGLRMIAWGVALTLAEAALLRVYDPPAATIAASAAGRPLVALGHALLWYPPFWILHSTAIAAILVGLVRTLGIDLGPSFDRPALARSITDWWRRWNVHFRELLVDLFYTRVLMRHRRTPVRATVLACASIFLVGSVLFHVPKLYFHHGTATVAPVGILVESALMFAIVAAALVREQRRAAPARPRPIVGALSTWALVWLAVFAAGRGAQTLWDQRVAELPAAAPSSVMRSHDVFPDH